ncbi:MAG TPA: hypothetical protein VLI39_06940 [Sedimentisphaerales bacterium]|nr:hypothetical protein [Sedimentisphaerales bacterium]
MRPETLRRLAWCLIACCLAIVVASQLVRHTVRTVYVRDPALATVPGIRLLDPNSELFEIVQRESDRPVVNWKNVAVHVTGGGRARMRQGAKTIKVMGELPGGKTYPVLIDTGNPGVAAVTSTVVLDAGLGVYPIGNPGDFRGGVCHLPELKMGEVTIADLACECWLGHLENRVFGRTVWIEREINVGLGLLKRFGYVRIDSIGGEVAFSTGHFQPEEPNDWRCYPMSINRDQDGRDRLLVSVPIDGRIVTTKFDTGAGPGLILTEKRRGEILSHARILGQERDEVATPGHGLFPCRKIILETLSIADLTLTRAMVHVTGDDNPHGPDDLTLGVGYFRDTVIVLDFRNNRLWIRSRPLNHP